MSYEGGGGGVRGGAIGEFVKPHGGPSGKMPLLGANAGDARGVLVGGGVVWCCVWGV